MTKTVKTLTYTFRRPKFPLICDLDGYLVAAKSAASFQRRLAGLELPKSKSIRVVDGNGEGWLILPKEMIAAPAFPMNRWRKIEIIRMFNRSRNARESGRSYPEHVIVNTRVDWIVNDIVSLLS